MLNNTCTTGLEGERTMRDKGMATYIGRLIAERGLGLLLFLLGSGWVLGQRGVLWFVVYFISIGSVIWLYYVAPETMKARLSIAESKEVTPTWDKILLAMFWVLGYFVVYWVAGLTVDLSMPIDAIAIIGAGVYLLSSVLTVWALRENQYAEAVARVQKERGQSVCSTGPYAFVRHPMYSAIIMWCVSIIMVLPSIWVAAVSVVVAAVITIRAELEEAMLAKELPGYSEYQSKVRWRVIPYIW